MGKSTKGFNSRCTVRGPISSAEIQQALDVVQRPECFNRHQRRAIKSRVRHHLRWTIKHDKSATDTQVRAFRQLLRAF